MHFTKVEEMARVGSRDRHDGDLKFYISKCHIHTFKFKIRNVRVQQHNL